MGTLEGLVFIIYFNEPGPEAAMLRCHDAANKTMTPSVQANNAVCICKNKLFYIPM